MGEQQIGSSDFQKEPARYMDDALRGIRTVITRRNRRVVVLMSVDEYDRLTSGRVEQQEASDERSAS